MADTIFLIHGIGHHPEKWHEPVVATLKELYGRYTLSRREFDERFTIKPISYDSVFRDLVSLWQADATALGQLAATVGADDVTKLVGWLRDAGDIDENFEWTHAADVLLYRLFFTVRQEIKTHVALQMAKEIAALSATQRWSVIAHSLGTAVAHDSLDMLWTGKREDGSATGFEPRHEQALVIAMIANVSRVLQTVPSAFESTVRPGTAGQAGHGCLTYMTYRHILDPFCIPKMFRPIHWPDEHAAERGAYLYVEVDHIHDLDVHDLIHYLKNPLVHIPIFRSLAGFQSAVTIDEELQALEKFRRFGDLSENVAIRFKEKLENIAPGINDEWQNYREIWDRFFDLFD